MNEHTTGPRSPTSTREMAAVLGITEGAVKTRHLRALQRFRKLMTEERREDES